MNTYLIKKIVDKIIENIDNFAVNSVWLYELNREYYMNVNFAFYKVNIPEGMFENIINYFNETNFALDNKCEIIEKEISSHKRWVVWFKN